MKKIAILTVITVLAFLSCDNFYSNSLGNSREYDWRQINLTTSNIGDWVRATVGNPPLARAVTEALIEKMNEDLDPDEMAIFMEFAARLAIESSGLGAAILINATELLGGIGTENADSFTDMLSNLQDDFNAGGGYDAARILALILSRNIDEHEGTPRFNDAYANLATPSAVAEAMIVLLLGEMADVDGELDITNLSNLATMGLTLAQGENGMEVQLVPDMDPPQSPNAVAIAAYLNLIADDDSGKFDGNPFTSAISAILMSGEIKEEDE